MSFYDAWWVSFFTKIGRFWGLNRSIQRFSAPDTEIGENILPNSTPVGVCNIYVVDINVVVYVVLCPVCMIYKFLMTFM